MIMRNTESFPDNSTEFSRRKAEESRSGIRWTARHGLAESLEQYARRHNTTPDVARFMWRVKGCYALGLKFVSVNTDGFRIAPNQPVDVSAQLEAQRRGGVRF